MIHFYKLACSQAIIARNLWRFFRLPLPWSQLLGVLLSCVCLAYPGFSQVTYTWNGLTSSSFETATNWTPSRAVAATNDVLVISKNATITSVPTQTIGALLLQANAQVILQAKAGTVRTLTCRAVTGLDINTGCRLSFTGTTLLEVNLQGNLRLAGQLAMHSTIAQQLLIGGNLNGTGGSLEMGTALLAHRLILQGATNQLSTFTTPAGSPAQVSYNGSSDQQVFGSVNYPHLRLSNGGIKKLGANLRVNATLLVEDATTLEVEAYNLTVLGNTLLEGNLTDAHDSGLSTFSSKVEIGLNGSLQAQSALSSFSFGHNLSVLGLLSAKTGRFTFTGSAKSIYLASPVEMGKATFWGTYVVGGQNLDLVSSTILQGGYLRHKSVSFPKILPSSQAMRGFNHPRFALSNKFSLFSLSPSSQLTSTDTDITFTKSSTTTGQIYAARTIDQALNPHPTGLMVSFELSVNATLNQTNAAMLMLGSNFDSTNITSTLSADRIGFSLTSASGVSLTHNDGTVSTVQATGSTIRVLWVVNNTAGIKTYTPPTAASINNFAGMSLAARSSDLWIIRGTTITKVWSGKAMVSTAYTLSAIKMMFTAGTGSITLKNLSLSPLAQISIDPLPCFTLGRAFSVPFTVTQTMSSGPIACFNLENTFRLEASNIGGDWVNVAHAGMDIPIAITVPNSVRFDAITGRGFIDGFIQQDWNLTDIRVRVRIVTSNSYVMSSENPVTTSEYTMWHIETSSYPQTLDVDKLTGKQIRAARAPSTTLGISLQWGYSTEKDGPFVPLVGQNIQTYTPAFADFPGKGTYFVKCLKTQGGDQCLSNSIIVYVNCDAPVNLIVNGDFSQIGTRIQRYDALGNPIYDFNDLNGNGVIEYHLGDWDSEYRDGAQNSNADLTEGDYIVGTEPDKQARVEWCSQTTTTNYRNGNLSTALQTKYGLLGYSPGGGGNMLIANANDDQSQILWGQHIYNLKMETDYVLTFWAAGVSTNNPNTLTFGAFINCRRVGDDISDRYNIQCHWNKYTVQFNTGALRDAYISINNISAARMGNDIALDDIQLIECGGDKFKPFIEFTWLGYTSDWFLPDNWGTCDEIPDCLDKVLIPAGKYHYPVINSDIKGLALAKDLTIEKGASITLGSDATRAYNLYVCGDIKNEGTIHGPGRLQLQGNTEQRISSRVGTFENVYINQSDPKGVYIYDFLDTGTSLWHPSTFAISGQLDIAPTNRLHISDLTLNQHANRLLLSGTLSYNTGTMVGSPKARLVISGYADLEGYMRFSTGITQGTTLGELSMQRAYNGMATLGTPLLVDSLLTLQSGIIYTSLEAVSPSALSPVLALSASGKVSTATQHFSGGSNLSYIDGPMIKHTSGTGFFTFPIGKRGHLGEAGINPSSSLTSSYQAQYFMKSSLLVGPAMEIPLEKVNTKEFWHIDRLAGEPALVSLHYTSYTDSEITTIDPGYLQVARYGLASNDNLAGTSPGDGVWRKKGNSFTAATSASSGYVISDLIHAFSPFTIAISTSISLPVEMISLKATEANGTVLVSWQTSLEKNTDHFRILRSENGKDFIQIGHQQASGESKTVKSYQFTDAFPVKMNYYRIETVDKDAKTQTSKTVAVSMVQNKQISLYMYPNPTSSGTLYLECSQAGRLQVEIIDMVGSRIYSYSLQMAGSPVNLLYGKELKKGIYFIALHAEGYSEIKKVIIY